MYREGEKRWSLKVLKNITLFLVLLDFCLLLASQKLTRDFQKHFLDVDLLQSWRLEEGAVPFCGLFFALLCRNHALPLQITFVPYQHHRKLDKRISGEKNDTFSKFEVNRQKSNQKEIIFSSQKWIRNCFSDDLLQTIKTCDFYV